ncbi:serine/threonine-protein kinase [Aquabacterium sp. OR-4]|uniref:serine/threonine-protein kinase n=1 Tax=Aquabacterium sp. OR-4 TaxID=2978127 RepID=UPI0028C650B9|nr:protein kinase [Aquabacterium sp. OR-4]MDT7837882.1 protein kinase [Aquabacterium sp. OR-4]
MSLAPADLRVLSRLLDQCLALGDAERETWLAALPTAQQRHVPQLRAMLAQAPHLDAERRWATLPGLGADETETAAQAGERVGAYRLVREIGRGGMGSVWLAARADGHFTRDVALKLPRLALDAGLAERMAGEREIAARLEHPHIARLYDAGIDARGRPYLAMAHIDGLPIDAHCRRHALDVPARLRLFLDVVQAVAYAHAQQVVHRDLKPSNVLVDSQGRAQLLDFGIARLLEPAGAEAAEAAEPLRPRTLTPAYAAPEVLQGRAAGVAADVYALGVMLFELLTGQLPHGARPRPPGAMAPLASTRADSPQQARLLRGDLDAILACALQVDPARRYAGAQALGDDILRHLQAHPVSARANAPLYRLQRWAARHCTGLVAATVVLATLVGGGGLALQFDRRAAQAAEREQVVKAFVADIFRASGNLAAAAASHPSRHGDGLVDHGAELIGQRFAGQPELQAELYGLVGEVYADMGAQRLAIGYAERQVAALESRAAAPVLRGRARLLLAQGLFDDERLADAEVQVRQALALAAGEPLVERDALTWLVRVQLALGQAEQAAATLDHLAARWPQAEAVPTLAGAWATAARARLLIARNRLDEGMPLFRAATLQAQAAQGPRSTVAATIQIAHAHELVKTTQAVPAQQVFDAAMATLQALGGAHAVRAERERARFAWVRYTVFFHGTAAEAIAQLEASRRALAASALHLPGWFLPQIEFWLGDVRSRSGDITEGLALLERSLPALTLALASQRERFQRADALGYALMNAGQHVQAEPWLQQRMALRRAMSGGTHPRAAFDYIHIAHNRMLGGAPDAAIAFLDQAPHFEPMRGEGGGADRYNQALRRARAAVHLARHEPAVALALLDQARPGPGAPPFDMAFDRLVRGEALCALGRAQAGLGLLRQQVADDDAGDDHALAPWRLRTQALLGLCAWAVGERGVARQAAERARAGFAAQSGVSAYYLAPLLRLDRLPGMRQVGPSTAQRRVAPKSGT